MSKHESIISLTDWVLNEAIPFTVDAPNAAIDKLIASLDDSVELLGFGEPLHGGEDFLMFRNRLFQRLVEAHGYTAIAVESSFPKGHFANEYLAGRGSTSYDAVRDTGFSHNFGRLEANRELIEWMRQYNADHPLKLRFYGFDSPTEMMGSDSPRQLLYFVLDYLASIGDAGEAERRQRIDSLIGEDAAWENPAVLTDPTKSIGLSPNATALRIETEELISELQTRRPEMIAKSDKDRFWEALQFASEARQLLNYHAELARESNERVSRLLGIRDAIMADNLNYIVSRERDRGKVLAFAHNSHLKRGKMQWQYSADPFIWWPAGAHLHEMFGARYAVIGSGVGVSDANGIAQPEVDTLEARLMTAPGTARFIPTHFGRGFSISEIAALPTRSGSLRNPTYFPLTAESFRDFDWLAILNSTTYSRGGPPLP